jgi:DNA-binding response OmpR family regulator
MSNYPAQPSDGNQDPSRTPPGRRPRTVLVAEDELAVREFLRAALEQAGFAVEVAPDGLAAGDLFVADPDRFALVLTDVIMPGALGTDLAARARKLRPGVPVLFMSAFPGGAGVAPEPLPTGEALLEKPFTVALLLEAVHGILGDAGP